MARLNRKRTAGAIAIAVVANVTLGWFTSPAPVAAFVSTTGNNWVWLNPLPQGGSLGHVSCPTVLECIAADRLGNVLETADAGSTWTAVNPWATTGIGARSLAGLDCPTAGECVAVAGNLTLSSADGGRTWTQHFASTQAFVYGLSCPTASSCEAVGQNGAIVSTADGGTTWTPRSSGTTSDLWAVSCTAGGTCVAAGSGGTIVNSSDGGGTWSHRASGTTFDLSGVSCPTATHCVAVGAAGTVLTSPDGGVSWTPQAAAGSSNLVVACSTASSCVMVGNGTGEGAFVSTDGGVTWVLKAVAALNGVSCPAATSACFADGDNGEILHSIDGGTTWTSLSSDPIVNGGRAVTCVAGGCIDVGYGGAATSTNGSAWTDRGGGGTLNAVSCVTIGFCVAVGRGNTGVILTSLDGGANWNPPVSGTPATFLNGVACVTSSTCVAVGAAGTIVTTGDAGQTWQNRSSAIATDLDAVSCGSSTECVAVGLQGKILSSTDAGVHWTPHSALSYQDLFGVSCPTTTFCIAVGRAYVLTSTDQFTSFSTYVTPYDLNAVSCAAALRCLAVGTYVAAKTYDGGATWSADSVGALLLGVSCPSTCWAVGSPGNGSAIVADSPRFTSVAQSSASGAPGSRAASVSGSPAGAGRVAVNQAAPQPPPLVPLIASPTPQSVAEPATGSGTSQVPTPRPGGIVTRLIIRIRELLLQGGAQVRR